MVRRLVLLAGNTIPSHHVTGDTIIYCIEGEIDFSVGLAAVEHTFRLSAGQLFLLKGGTEHRLLGIQNASILITNHL